MAPEVIQESYDNKCDVWSAGIVMYTLLTDKMPFDGKNDQDIVNLVLKKTLLYTKKTDFGRLTTPCIDLLRRMLFKQAIGRISAIEALNHPAMQNGVYKEDTVLMRKMCLEFRRFRKRNVLQRTLSDYIIEQLLPYKMVQYHHRVFFQMNKDDTIIS